MMTTSNTNNNNPALQKRALPLKESALFKSALKFYENRQYKKGLKATEQILKKFPEHGESLAMKGLFLANMERKDEGYDCVKKGLRNDLTSHICWHVYGLVYRADKNYPEASKCYTQALKLDKGNVQILRDYSLLQIQMRNYEAYLESRRQLLELRPGNKLFWIGLAVGYHFNKEYDTAIKVLTAYQESLKDTVVVDTEIAELLLYKNLLLEESGDLEKALEDLYEIEPQVFDKTAIMEAKGRILVKLDKLDQAYEIYSALFTLNPDNKLYLEGLEKCKPVDYRLSFYRELSSKFTHSSLLKQVSLRCTTSETDFESYLSDYLQNGLRKGIPSLFVSIRDLYSESWKVTIIEKLLLSFVSNLQSKLKFTENGQEELPTALLWTFYTLAQHYDYSNNTKSALEYVNLAIENMPTLVEAYMQKARILKHAGAIQEAAKIMNQARELDLQDRFINSKATKYYIRANQLDEGAKTIGLFTRADASTPVVDLIDMQCFWFLTETADYYRRTKDYGMALKYYHLIDKIFSDMYDDQFDFHAYCLRKLTVRSYVSMIEFEDHLKDHPYYLKAAVKAIEIYFELIDKPAFVEEQEKENKSNTILSASEKKKLARKKKNSAENVSANNTNSNNSSGGDKPTTAPVDDDPKGLKYIAENVDYLTEALKFAKTLNEASPSNVEGWAYSAEIHLRQGKLLLALRSLCKLEKLNPTHHRCISLQVRLWTKIEEAVSSTSTIHDKVKTILEKEVNDYFKVKASNPIELFTNAIKNTQNTCILTVLELARLWSDVFNQKAEGINLLNLAFKSKFVLGRTRNDLVISSSKTETQNTFVVNLDICQKMERDLYWFIHDETLLNEWKTIRSKFFDDPKKEEANKF